MEHQSHRQTCPLIAFRHFRTLKSPTHTMRSPDVNRLACETRDENKQAAARNDKAGHNASIKQTDGTRTGVQGMILEGERWRDECLGKDAKDWVCLREDRGEVSCSGRSWYRKQGTLGSSQTLIRGIGTCASRHSLAIRSTLISSHRSCPSSAAGYQQDLISTEKPHDEARDGCVTETEDK
jgi:hypothetical protein